MSAVAVETDRLADLAAFAAIEVASRDVEPWADLLAQLYQSSAVDIEGALWLVKLYNAYDDLGSAWSVFLRWGSPMAWYLAPDAADAANYPCTQERRNLRGGRVIKHLAHYAAMLGLDSQHAWVTRPLSGDPQVDFLLTTAHVRNVWGVGRQTAFEWAEFVAKVIGVPLAAPDADLWESEGPRRSLQRLYGEPKPSLAWLNARADECRDGLAAAGVELSWEDFETIICDFNVMRDGRYYPGKHLAALREEIAGVGPLEDAFAAVVPEPWRSIAPGVDKAKAAVYRDTGQLVMAP